MKTNRRRKTDAKTDGHGLSDGDLFERKMRVIGRSVGRACDEWLERKGIVTVDFMGRTKEDRDDGCNRIISGESQQHRKQHKKQHEKSNSDTDKRESLLAIAAILSRHPET